MPQSCAAGDLLASELQDSFAPRDRKNQSLGGPVKASRQPSKLVSTFLVARFTAPAVSLAAFLAARFLTFLLPASQRHLR
jgi:hypothetical protein